MIVGVHVHLYVLKNVLMPTAQNLILAFVTKAISRETVTLNVCHIAPKNASMPLAKNLMFVSVMKDI